MGAKTARLAGRAPSSEPVASPPRSPGRIIQPLLDRERLLWSNGTQVVAGVDEVGVGPLCGPVVAAAVVLAPTVDVECLKGVRDSKTVPTAEQRERLALAIRSVAARIGVGAASAREIERLNVRGATRLAMLRALSRVGPYDHAIVDGNPHRGFDLQRHTFVVGGDASCLSIACASLVAKVMRDHLMCLLAARYPAYGWEHNRGYATAAHLDALRRCGPTVHHRAHFRPVLQMALELEDAASDVSAELGAW